MSQYATVEIPPHQKKHIDGSTGKRKPHREVRFGNYVLGSTLGEGEFGKVKLGWKKDGKLPSQAAIKLIKRDSIPTGSQKEEKIYREISALKKLRHPNIVRLVEVLQNDKYIGIVLEYASGGELFDYILDHRYLKESMACRLFAQLVSGVNYMHSKGIVHRDLKLENLLLDKHKNIIITDFGFVNTFQNSANDLMKTSCGSPCYAAPELVVSNHPYEARKVDVWSCGVILYAMLAGYLPFDDDPENPDGSNIARLYHYITHTSLTFPEYIQPTPRDLLRRILVSNPKRRISLKEVTTHRWLAPHMPFLSVSPIEWDKNYRTSKLLAHQQDNYNNRRMSLMENPTSASLMLNKPTSHRPYSTQNVKSLLYSNPAAPQTSKTVAIPSDDSSPISSPLKNSMTISMDSSSDQINQGITRHSRSGSAASLVLQAVVEADTEKKKRYSNGSSEILTTPVKNTKQRPISFVPLLSDTANIFTVDNSNNSISSISINNSNNMNNINLNTNNKNRNFETIKESPEHSKISNVLPPPTPIFNKPSSNTHSSTTKLPSSRINKPRPTSYHPSYASNFTPSDLSYLSSTNHSEGSLKLNTGTSRVKIANSSVYSSTSESLISTSLKEMVIPESVDDDQTNTQTGQLESITKSFDTLALNKPSATSPIISDKIKFFNEDVETINTKTSAANNNNDPDSTIIENDDSEKENLPSSSSNILPNEDIKPQPTIENPKYKRFSLLSFYQTTPGPSEPLTLNKRSPLSPHPEYEAKSRNVSSSNPNASSTATAHANSNSNAKSAKTNNKYTEASTNKSERRVSSVNVHDSKKADRVERETSTARKVMDFFKRRSMRI